MRIASSAFPALPLICPVPRQTSDKSTGSATPARPSRLLSSPAEPPARPVYLTREVTLEGYERDRNRRLAGLLRAFDRAGEPTANRWAGGGY